MVDSKISDSVLWKRQAILEGSEMTKFLDYFMRTRQMVLEEVMKTEVFEVVVFVSTLKMKLMELELELKLGLGLEDQTA